MPPDRKNYGTVAICQDGSRIAVTLSTQRWGESIVRVMNTTTGKVISEFVPRDWVDATEFSPNGKLLVTVEAITGHERRFRLWDVEAGKEIFKPLKTNYDYFADRSMGFMPVAFSVDGKRLAVGRQNGFAVYDISSGSEIFSQPDVELSGTDIGLLDSICFTADGSRLLVINSNRVHFLDAATGKPQMESWKLTTLGAELSTDGHWLICASRQVRNDPYFLTVWDTRTHRKVRQLQNADYGESAAISAEGHWAAVPGVGVGNEYTDIWDLGN